MERKNKKRSYTALPHEYLEEMDGLTDEEYGRLVRALQRYARTGEQSELVGNERFFLRRVCNREDRYQEEYALLCEKRRVSGKLGAEARWGSHEEAMANDSKNGNTKTETETKTEAKAKAEANTETETKTETPASSNVVVDRIFLTPVQESTAVPVHDDAKKKPERAAPGSYEAVLSYFRQRVNPSPTELCCKELKEFYSQMGAQMCCYAMDRALDEQNRKWSYIRGILRKLHRDGIRNSEQLGEHERRRAQQGAQSKDGFARHQQTALSEMDRRAIARALEEGE